MNRQALPGGFSGVDVFFVISGYLITSIIYREVQAGSFSVLSFYERRVRRIYPALVAVIAATAVAGVLIFMPDELKDLGASIVATVLSGSNFLFWLQVDYFAGPAEFKPLLHTWSLAVEEQFYIVFPLLVLLLVRVGPRLVKPAIAGLLLLSFALSCAWTWIDPSGNYFLPHTRAWEMLVGSALAVGLFAPIETAARRQIASVAGLVALAAPLFLLDETSPFPAWNAVSTCLGTALLIHTGAGQTTIGARLLSLKPLVGVGLISYSVYLVHWPLIAFTRYELMRDPTVTETVALGLGSLFLGFLSWAFIERPFRRRQSVGRPLLFGSAAAACATFSVFGAVAFITNGLPQRLGKDAALAVRDDTQTAGPPGCFMKGDWKEWPGEACFLTERGHPVTMLWGDSHANHFAPALRSSAEAYTESVLLYASAGCAPVLNVDLRLRKNCQENNLHALDVIRQYDVKRVVLSAYWERVLDLNDIKIDAIAATVQRLTEMGIEIAVIGDNPDFPFSNPQFLGQRLAKQPAMRDSYYTDVRNNFGFNPQLQAMSKPATFFDPMKVLCREHKCLAYVNMQPMMRDNAHFTSFGAALALKAMQPFATSLDK